MAKRGNNLNLPNRTIKSSASIWKRMFAFVVDLLILDILILNPFKKMLSSLIPITSYSEASTFLLNNPDVAGSINIIFFCMGIIAVFYFTIFEYKLSQTPGKMLFNIYAVGEGNFWKYLLSNLTFIPIFPFILLWIVDAAYLLMHNERFMEKLANIKVIQETII